MYMHVNVQDIYFWYINEDFEANEVKMEEDFLSKVKNSE